MSVTDWMTALSTLVLVMVTAWYARITQKLLWESQQARRDQLMPVIYVRGVPMERDFGYPFRAKKVSEAVAVDLTVESVIVAHDTGTLYATGAAAFSTVNVEEERSRVYSDISIPCESRSTDFPRDLLECCDNRLLDTARFSGHLSLLNYKGLSGERFSTFTIQMSAVGKPVFIERSFFTRNATTLKDMLFAYTRGVADDLCARLATS